MEIYNLPGSLLILVIVGIFLRRLWLGAILALVGFVTVKLFFSSDYNSITSQLITGMIITAELSLLLFGAYFFYKILHANNHFDSLNKVMAALSSKLSIVVVLCYFLGSFMEGVAGFGIPAMLIAPMLFTLGLKPLSCIILPLAANTTAVTFGALGTPLKMGLGIVEPDTVVSYTILLNYLPVVALPFLLAFLYEKTEQIKLNWRETWRILLAGGFIYATLYALAGAFTIEYVSVIAGAVGLMIFVFLNSSRKENPTFLVFLKTFYPYILYITLHPSKTFLN